MTAPLARIIDEPTFARLVLDYDDRDHQLSQPYLSAMVSHRGEHLDRVIVEVGSEIVALAAVRTRRVPMLGAVAVAAGGPVVGSSGHEHRAINHQLALQALTREYRRRGTRLHVRPPVLPTIEGWMPDSIGSDASPSPLFDQYHTMVVDLDQTEERRRQAISTQWRRHLRESEAAGLDCLEIGIGETWQQIRPLYLETQKRKKFNAPLPLQFWDQVFRTEQADRHFRGVVVQQRGRSAAGVIIGGDSAVTTFLLGASAHFALPLRAGYLAMWAAIGLAKRAGHRYFDLGGVDREKNPGGWQFKHGLRGRDVSTPRPIVAGPDGARGRVMSLAEKATAAVRSRRR